MSARIALTLMIALSSLSLMFSSAWPGGEAEFGTDHHHDDGPNYFGFVKDTSGRVIPDAKVTADIKGLGSVVARTNATGAYRIPGFGNHIPPQSVTISCSKDGYKQTRTFTRTPLSKKPLTAIETECTMQRLSTK
jgi:Carboxypeptidase regulatory-like domain